MIGSRPMLARAATALVSFIVALEIALRLYKGNVFFEDAKDADQSLYSEDIASMERVGSFDHTDSEGFLNVLGVSARNYAERQFEALDREEIPMPTEGKPLVEAG